MAKLNIMSLFVATALVATPAAVFAHAKTGIIDACGECDGRQTGKDHPDVQREIDWSYREGRTVYDRNGQGHVA